MQKSSRIVQQIPHIQPRKGSENKDIWMFGHHATQIDVIPHIEARRKPPTTRGLSNNNITIMDKSYAQTDAVKNLASTGASFVDWSSARKFAGLNPSHLLRSRDWN